MLRLAYRIQSSILYSLLITLAGCHHETGATSFISAPPGGSGGADRGGAPGAAGGGDAAAAPPTDHQSSSAPPRTVEETDLYRLEGDRLYYLNGYRGLMVFDVSDVDHPRLL